ncbi:MAG: NAD(P)H-binding protein [Acidobacteriaceae bacterium]|nr:NAD(P)H-binding protein [Acidobacteriaceae bacterium]
MIYQELANRHAFSGHYASVKPFVRPFRQRRPGPSACAVIVTPPGEEAQVDYGRGPILRSPTTNRHRDHTAAQALFRASGLHGTIVRPTALSNEAGQDWSEAGPETSILRKIPRTAVAAALLDLLEGRAKHRTVSITGA